MHGWQTLIHGSHTCWFDEQLFPDFSVEAFDPAYWQAQDAVTGQSRGRGVTWFVRHRGLSLVLRHYWRGGLMGKINPDRFWFHGVESSRAMAEFRLLGQLRELGLPVPRPVAARLQRQGLWYRADLLIEQIPGARDLVHLLREQSLTAAQWQAVGALIARLHQAGAYHSDLNAHNLLLDGDDQIWVIDFDKCGLREPGPWQAEMLARLLRSLRKEAGLHPGFHWQEADWEQVMQGYQTHKAGVAIQ